VRPQFDVLRACFILLAIILITQITITAVGGVFCFYFFLTGSAKIGDCAAFTSQAREIWAEALAIVLALLLAASKPPTPPNTPPDAAPP
jgi:hypothetical protein